MATTRMDIDDTMSSSSSSSSDGERMAPPRKRQEKPTPQYPTTTGLLRNTFRSFGNVATVLVGPTKVKYLVHSGLLISASPYFAAALSGNFTEASSQTVTLEDERADIFEWFIQWLYTGSLTSASPTNCSPPVSSGSYKSGTVNGSKHRSMIEEPSKNFHEPHFDGDLRNSAGSPKYFLLIELYGLSDRLLTTSLSNHIIDTIARLSEATNSVPTPSDTWILYGDCASYSGLHPVPRSTGLKRHDSATDLSCTSPASPPTPLSPPAQPTLLRPGIRPSSPLHDLILDLFTYKKTDRLLTTHRDDWHPLFLRDLVVRIKRPGRDVLARHTLRPWRARCWAEAKACDACRAVVGPDNAGITTLSRGAAPRHIPAPPQQQPNRSRRRAIGAADAIVNAIPDNPDVFNSSTGLHQATQQGGPLRCSACMRVYCAACLGSGVHGHGLRDGDAKWALVGGEIGGCKPWLSWDAGLARDESEHEDGDTEEEGEEQDEELEEGELQEDGGRGRRGVRADEHHRRHGLGVCGRYHEHGPLGGRRQIL